MEKTALKRLRSDESENIFVHQSKILVNDKILAVNDVNKMTQIHEKTVNKLFDAVRALKLKEPDNDTVPLWQRIILAGNGKVDFFGLSKPLDFPVEAHKKKATCCQRLTLVQAECTSCCLAMCENCGISCSECFTFICNKCVVIFGCGTMDRPICEKCNLYN